MDKDKKVVIAWIVYILSLWFAFSIPHVFIVMPIDKFVFYALAYLVPVIAFHSHWMRLFFAHILAAVWIHPATLFEFAPERFLNDSDQYEYLSKIQSPGDMSWYSLNDVSERLAESLLYDALIRLDIHTIFYVLYPPSVVLAFWACVFFVQEINSDKKES